VSSSNHQASGDHQPAKPRESLSMIVRDGLAEAASYFDCTPAPSKASLSPWISDIRHTKISRVTDGKHSLKINGTRISDQSIMESRHISPRHL
jgi:hypothetical protein